eukprot:gnl/TRDRNA2_/TRDRNA2_173840_c28_seq3.p1 gnl/TRDRNA2_/TRDRNA2_173840_c28~~gnl/TRDRNA2_/TRDRNA2_173840_c28_seq3.p1  ORF type:complete len:123 (-),score=8.76 gnl/TRDRNA2_/TRDRNA2_173840_c28_seq3:206-574(-)
MVWAFATGTLLDENLFEAVAREAEHRVSNLKSQHLANTAWSFAMVKLLDAPLFTALAREVERRVGEFDSPGLAHLQTLLWHNRMLGLCPLFVTFSLQTLPWRVSSCSDFAVGPTAQSSRYLR